MVFGPGLDTINSMQVLVAEVDLGAVLLVQRAHTGNYVVSLAYRPRAWVAVSATSCTPDVVTFVAFSQSTFVVSCLDDSPIFLASSSDPSFDGVSAMASSNSGGSSDDGVVSRIIIGATTTLATLVAILFVWLYMGPQSFKVQIRRIKGKRSGGKRSVAAEGGGGGAATAVAAASASGANSPMGELAEHSSSSSAGFSALFSVPPPLAFYSGQTVVVYYDFDGSFYVGQVTQAHGDGTYNVEFQDGDLDEVVDGDNMRVWNGAAVRPRSSMSRKLDKSGLVDVSIPVGREGGFGIKLGITSAGRVVVTGFAPDGPALQVLDVALGDEVVSVRLSDETFAQVGKLVKDSGELLRLKVRPGIVDGLTLS